MVIEKTCILIVDDTSENIDVLRNILGDEYKLKVALNGKKALDIAKRDPKPDLILLDIMMPEMDGYEVCKILKNTPETKDIGIIFQTSQNAPVDEQKGFELGASDYITKPFEPEVVKSRIKAVLSVLLEKKKSDELVHNILPKKVANELKSTGKATAKKYENVTILFTDFKDFTSLVSSISAIKLVEELNDIFGYFDDIMEEFQIEKIETIGDAYMAACGLPEENADHAVRCIDASKKMLKFLKDRNKKNEIQWEMRVGIHSGPVVAGVVGKKKYAYSLFGDTVNTASRIETNGEVGKINISNTTYNLIKGKYNCIPRGQIHAKGKGNLDMYFVD